MTPLAAEAATRRDLPFPIVERASATPVECT
jgi:hypothetical protein